MEKNLGSSSLLSGYMTCPHKQCALAFVALKSMRNHYKTCPGSVAESDYVVCNICGARINRLRYLVAHKAKIHGVRDLSHKVNDALLANSRLLVKGQVWLTGSFEPLTNML